MMRRSPFIVLAGAILAAVAPATRGDELSRMREDYERSLREKTRLLDETHRLNLRQLERQMADGADYEAAQAVKERIAVLEAQMGVPNGASTAAASGNGGAGSAGAPANGASVNGPKSIVLTAQAARTLPGASYDRNLDAVELRKRGGQAQWDVNRCQPGSYDVYLTYSVAVGPPPVAKSRATGTDTAETLSKFLPVGGTLGWSEVTSLGGGTDPGLVRPITQTTGGAGQFITEHLGRHELKHASATLRVEAVEAEAGGLLRVKKMELVPATPEPPAGTTETAPAGPATLEQLQREYRTQIQPLMEPVRLKYDASLAELEQHLKAKGDAEALAAVQAERKRLNRAGNPKADPQ